MNKLEKAKLDRVGGLEVAYWQVVNHLGEVVHTYTCWLDAHNFVKRAANPYLYTVSCVFLKDLESYFRARGVV